MARILFVASAGGHLTELLRVREHLKGHEAVFAVNSPTELPSEVEGRLVSIRHRVGWRLVENLFEFISLFRRLAPDLLVTNGAGHAVMAALAARFFRVPIVYIEIGASTRVPSRTGKIMTLLRLADRYLYPWEPLSRFFPRGTCTGPLL